MIHAEHIYTLPVPPAVVYPYLANPNNDVEWQSSCVASRLLASLPAVGCRYNISFSFLGRTMQFLAEITTLAPEQDYAFKVVEGSFHYEGGYSMRPHAEGTEVHWRFAAEPGKFFGILPPALLRKVLINQVEKDALNLARRLTVGA